MVEHISHYITQPEIDAATERSQKVAREVAALNPAKPRERHSKEIKLDVARLIADPAKDANGLEGSLPRWKRLLSEKQNRRTELLEAIKRSEKQVEELRTMGADSRHPKIREIVGFDFRNKFNEVVHHDGIIENLKAQLAEVETRIPVLETAVKNTERFVRLELPKLEAELKAALKRESLL